MTFMKKGSEVELQGDLSLTRAAVSLRSISKTLDAEFCRMLLEMSPVVISKERGNWLDARQIFMRGVMLRTKVEAQIDQN